MRRHNNVEEASQELQVGDIVLMHRKRGVLNMLIRYVSGGSPWNHSAMVFSVIEAEGKKHVILIEAQPHGIELHRLEKYLNKENLFAFGFKRLPGLTDEQRERIRGFFLDGIDARYAYASLFGWMIEEPVRNLFGTRIKDFIERLVIDPNDFVCSSFAQRAYYLALPPNERDRALFVPEDQADLNFLFRLTDITPADIAESTNTVWLWGEEY